MPSLEENFSVFDLPNLRRQPSFQDLLVTLQGLEIKPTIWGQVTSRSRQDSHEAGISRYLTGIISSSLEWFHDSEEGDAEEQREILWDLASKRVTERCGRSAMGELNRTWVIPASETAAEVQFTIREPPLTGDNLGFKTWGTAFTMAKKLDDIAASYLRDVLSFPTTNAQVSNAKVLELGSGTGLVGIAAAAIWSVNVLLTDLEEIKNNLDFNIQQNLTTVTERGAKCESGVLDWKSDDHPSQVFDVVIAADSVYDDDHPQLVSNMLKKYLKRDSQSRALVAVPLRDKNTIRMAGELKKLMADIGLGLIHEGWEICKDDWETGSEDEDGVKCWWAIFGWETQDGERE